MCSAPDITLSAKVPRHHDGGVFRLCSRVVCFVCTALIHLALSTESVYTPYNALKSTHTCADLISRQPRSAIPLRHPLYLNIKFSVSPIPILFTRLRQIYVCMFADKLSSQSRPSYYRSIFTHRLGSTTEKNIPRSRRRFAVVTMGIMSTI